MQFRLEGQSHAVEHHLTNNLTLGAGMGCAQLLVYDREPPQRLRDMARLVPESALASVSRVRRLSTVSSLQLIESGAPGGPLLGLGPPVEQASRVGVRAGGRSWL